MQLNRTFIIAEAGVNHNGNLDKALEMIKVAANAGADAIKFQTFKASSLTTRNAQKAKYQLDNTDKKESQYAMIRKLELTIYDHKVLMRLCKQNRIKFLSSPFDIDSILLLRDLGLDIYKIPSGEITNLPYLEVIGRLNKKIILSTGMSYLHEVKEAVDVLTFNGTCRNNITVLHTNTQYPTLPHDVNLKAMMSIRDELGVNIGFSDHTKGIEISLAAVALGAKIIEKHFTLSRNLAGPDHKASLEPNELIEMIKGIRKVEDALGSGRKIPTNSEKHNISVVRKSIVAANNIKKGEVFSAKNLTVKRPGVGISPMRWYEVMGKVAKRNYFKDELIDL